MHHDSAAAGSGDFEREHVVRSLPHFGLLARSEGKELALEEDLVPGHAGFRAEGEDAIESGAGEALRGAVRSAEDRKLARRSVLKRFALITGYGYEPHLGNA